MSTTQQPPTAPIVVVRIRPSDGAACLDWDDETVTLLKQSGPPSPPSTPTAAGTPKGRTAAGTPKGRRQPGTPTAGMTPKGKRQHAGGSKFFFDAVHGPDSSQSAIFDHARALVSAAKSGKNVCILAYGATGSGKSHTMHGTASDPGLVPLAVEQLFSTCGDASYKLTVCELYNDKITDLLVPLKKNPLPFELESANQAAAKIRLLADGGLIGSDTFRSPVANCETMHALLRRAQAARSVASTVGNDRSSRSHMLIRIELTATDGEGRTVHGRLEFVDLAGVEPLLGSSSTQETVSINRSLAALCHQISSLSREKFGLSTRDNKLTQLLSGSVGGNALTLLVATVHSAADQLRKTQQTIELAARMSDVRSEAVVNVAATTPVGASLRAVAAEQQREIAKLKAELEETQRAREASRDARQKSRELSAKRHEACRRQAALQEFELDEQRLKISELQAELVARMQAHVCLNVQVAVGQPSVTMEDNEAVPELTVQMRSASEAASEGEENDLEVDSEVESENEGESDEEERVYMPLAAWKVQAKEGASMASPVVELVKAQVAVEEAAAEEAAAAEAAEEDEDEDMLISTLTRPTAETGTHDPTVELGDELPPILQGWRLKASGRNARKVEGRVFGKVGYKDGIDFATSDVAELHSTHVVTESGTIYRLGEPWVAASTQRPRRVSTRLSFAPLAGGASAGLPLVAPPLAPPTISECGDVAQADMQAAGTHACPVVVDIVDSAAVDEPPTVRRSRRSSAASRPLRLEDFPPLQSQVLTPRTSGPTWCTVAAHVEGKLQIQLPEGGKEALSLIDLHGWMKRAPLGRIMGLGDVLRVLGGHEDAAEDTAEGTAEGTADEAGEEPVHPPPRTPLAPLAETNRQGDSARPETKGRRRQLHSERGARALIEEQLAL